MDERGVSCRYKIFCHIHSFVTSTAGDANLITRLLKLRSKKRFNIFWNKLTNTDRQRVIMIIGIDSKPVKSLTHLKCILALTKYYNKEKWIYGSLEK